MTDLWCLGCGRKIWSGDVGRAGLAITCYCGAHALRTEAGDLVWPASFYTAGGGHIEYMLGWSDHTDIHKVRAEETLVARGYTRADECPDPACRDRTRARRLEIVAALRRRPQDLEWLPVARLCDMLQLTEPRLRALFLEAGLPAPRKL